MSDLPSGLDAAINLPTSLFEPFQTEDSLSIFFVHYKKPTLFPLTVNVSRDNSVNLSRHPKVVSTVLAATVGQDISFRDLHERDANVTVLFQLKIPHGMVNITGRILEFPLLCVKGNVYIGNRRVQGKISTVSGENTLIMPYT